MDFMGTYSKTLLFRVSIIREPWVFELYLKARQKPHCITPKIVWLFPVSKIRKFEHEGWSGASDNFLPLTV